jgi:hypothetical protein
MGTLADDLCAEVRHQCEQAEHFKGLWLRANNELELARSQLDELRYVTNSLVERWDTPLWRDLQTTTVYINDIRDVISKVEKKP